MRFDYTVRVHQIPVYTGADDQGLYVIRQDMSGGVNTQQNGIRIKENQAVLLYNIDIGIPGQSDKRPGLTLIEDLGAAKGVGLFGFEPDGGTNELLAFESTNLKGYIGSGTFTTHDSGFTANHLTYCVKCLVSGGLGEVVIIQNGTDNAHQMLQDHTVADLGDSADDAPVSIANLFFRGRLWVLKNGLLYWSDAYPTDTYDGGFNRATDNFKIPCGAERALIGIRDQGIICVGADSIWGINPSVAPAAADKAEKLLDIGCVAPKSVVQVGDDVYFMSPDGIRALFRTIQDKVQLGQSYPLSYVIKDNFDNINWAYIQNASAVYFDNKYFFSVATGSSTYNNEVWVYYPSIQAWTIITGWNVADWAVVKFGGEEQLFAIESSADGKVYRAWYGYDDNGTAINYQEDGRIEDLGQPFVKKVAGEVEIKAQTSGNYDVDVYAQFDGNGWQLLGVINLRGNSNVLPIASLPFILEDSNVIREKFHLDSYGPWRTIQLRLQHNDTNGTDTIRILERNVITFPEEYLSE